MPIEVGTPVARCPLADPGVRNYRTGLLEERARRVALVLDCLVCGLIMQIGVSNAIRLKGSVGMKGLRVGSAA